MYDVYRTGNNDFLYDMCRTGTQRDVYDVYCCGVCEGSGTTVMVICMICIAMEMMKMCVMCRALVSMGIRYNWNGDVYDMYRTGNDEVLCDIYRSGNDIDLYDMYRSGICGGSGTTVIVTCMASHRKC